MKSYWKVAVGIALLIVATVIGVKALRSEKVATSAAIVPSRSSHQMDNARTPQATKLKPDLAKWQSLLDDSLPSKKRLELTEALSWLQGSSAIPR